MQPHDNGSQPRVAMQQPVHDHPPRGEDGALLEEALKDFPKSFESKLRLSEDELDSTDKALQCMLRRHRKEIQELPQRHAQEIMSWRDAIQVST